MNPKVKAKWLAALRSGEYKQTRDVLRDDDGFCCLGVLCDLHAQETGMQWGEAGGVNLIYPYGDSRETLPAVVAEWADLYDGDPAIPGRDFKTLGGLNDAGYSFTELADIIEKELP